MKKKNKMGENGKNGIILSQNVSLPIDKRKDVGTIVIGENGSGKTCSFVLPNLYNLLDNTSYVIADRGGKLYRKTADFMRENGWEVVYFNPYDKESLKWTPLNYIFHSEGKAIQVADIITREMSGNGGMCRGGYWGEVEFAVMRLVVVYIFLHFSGVEGDVDFNRILGLLKEMAAEENLDYIPQKFRKQYEYCLENNICPEYIRCFNLFTLNSKKVKKSVLIDLATKLMPFASGEIAERIDKDWCKIYTLFNSNTVVYVGFGEDDTSYDLFSRMFIYECINESIKRAEDTKQHYYLRFILDDFDLLGDFRNGFPDFPKAILECKNRNFTFHVTAQNNESLKSVYGENGVKTLFEICPNIVFFGSSNDVTNRFIIARSSRADRSSKNRVTSSALNYFENIVSLKEGMACILLPGYEPIIDEKLGDLWLKLGIRALQ